MKSKRAFVSTKHIAKGTALLQCQATGNSVVLLDHLVGERCDVCLADTATKPCGNKSCAAVLCATCKRSPQHASVCGAASREPVLVRSLLRLAAAERADGAVAKQLDALENHHDAYGPERRDAFKAAAARAASYCGGDARRLARHAAAFESNEFGVSETNRWRHAPLELGEESVGLLLRERDERHFFEAVVRVRADGEQRDAEDGREVAAAADRGDGEHLLAVAVDHIRAGRVRAHHRRHRQP